MHNTTTDSITFSDCKLRDGGYYTDWDFNISQAQEYIDNFVICGVDVIELGFRFVPKTKYLGPFVYTRETLLVPTSYSEANIDKVLAQLLSQPEGESDVTGQRPDRTVMLVGLDGYDGQSRSLQNIAQLLVQLVSKSKIKAVSLTKTHHNLSNQSVFTDKNCLK